MVYMRWQIFEFRICNTWGRASDMSSSQPTHSSEFNLCAEFGAARN